MIQTMKNNMLISGIAQILNEFCISCTINVVIITVTYDKVQKLCPCKNT